MQDLPGVTSQTEWGRNILFQLPQAAPIHYEGESSDGEGSENEGDGESSGGEKISELTVVLANDANADSSDGVDFPKMIRMQTPVMVKQLQNSVELLRMVLELQTMKMILVLQK